MKIVLLIVLGLACIYSLSKLTEVLIQDYDNYVASGKCIKKHIARGIERRDIIVVNATCTVRAK